MEQRLGEDIEDAMKAMTKNGIPRGVAKKALEIAEQKGRFTIFALVDALTRLAREQENAGDRTDAGRGRGSPGLRVRPLMGHPPIWLPLSSVRRTSVRPTRNPPSRSGACRRLRPRKAAWSYRKAPFHFLKALPCCAL